MFENTSRQQQIEQERKSMEAAYDDEVRQQLREMRKTSAQTAEEVGNPQPEADEERTCSKCNKTSKARDWGGMGPVNRENGSRKQTVTIGLCPECGKSD